MLLDSLSRGILQLRRAGGELRRRGRDKDGVKRCPAETSLLLLLLSGSKLKQLRNWRKFKDWASNSSKPLPPSASNPPGPCLDPSGCVKRQYICNTCVKSQLNLGRWLFRHTIPKL